MMLAPHPHHENLTWQALLLKKLVPLTIDNIIAGVVFAPIADWVIFLGNAE